MPEGVPFGAVATGSFRDLDGAGRTQPPGGPKSSPLPASGGSPPSGGRNEASVSSPGAQRRCGRWPEGPEGCLNAILGQELGMTQVFDDEAQVAPEGRVTLPRARSLQR